MADFMTQMGPGRYVVQVRLPWGQRVPAEMLVSTVRGWLERPESGDPRWTPYVVGPVVLSLRLLAPVPPAVGSEAVDVVAGPLRGEICP